MFKLNYLDSITLGDLLSKFLSFEGSVSNFIVTKLSGVGIPLNINQIKVLSGILGILIILGILRIGEGLKPILKVILILLILFFILGLIVGG